jgi:hypothetical protein
MFDYKSKVRARRVTVIGGDFTAKNFINKNVLEAAKGVKLIQYY